jgi:hypothetical protein
MCRCRCLRVIKAFSDDPAVVVSERPLLSQLFDHVDDFGEDGVRLAAITDGFGLIPSFAIALLEFLVKNHGVVVVDSKVGMAWSAATRFVSSHHASANQAQQVAASTCTAVNSGRVKDLTQQVERRARLLLSFVTRDGAVVRGLDLRRRIQHAEMEETHDPLIRLADRKVRVSELYRASPSN